MAKKRRLAKNLPPEQLEAIISAACDEASAARTPAKKHATWRDFVMVATALYAGLRASETCNLKVEDVDLASPTLAVVHGKGDKDRNVPIGVKLLTILGEWIGDRKSGWLFPGPKGRSQVSSRTFRHRLAQLAKKASLERRVHPHLLRHTFATSLLRTGADLREVQELLGHANLQTTATYLHVEVGRMKKAVDRL